MVGTSFQNAAYGAPDITQRNASFEILVSPDGLDRHNQVIFETGGATAGVGLALE